MKRPKIAVILRTPGLDYDDRVRKECNTLSKYADVFVFVVFTDNTESEGETSYGIPYKSFRLKTRETLPSGRFLFIKALDFYLQVRKHLEGFDLIWAHEEYTLLFALLGSREMFIWDLHELPKHSRTLVGRYLFNHIEKKCKRIIHANSFRIRYLIENGYIKHPDKHVFVRNYPDKTFLRSKEHPANYDHFNEWLNGDEYVYLQGVSGIARYPFNSIASVIETTDYKIVVVGSFWTNEEHERLKTVYGNLLEQRVYFTGMINQLAIPALLRNAKFSIILYETSNPNNRFCEANRLYQAISLGVPVITGNNEPMADVVNQHNTGIAMDSDGRSLDELNNTIISLLNNYSYYKANAEEYGSTFIWNDLMIEETWIEQKP